MGWAKGERGASLCPRFRALAPLSPPLKLSIALGFFNLLPIPALDGGRAVFVMLEAVTRRKLNAKLETLATRVGFVMLISLIVFVSFR